MPCCVTKAWQRPKRERRDARHRPATFGVIAMPAHLSPGLWAGLLPLLTLLVGASPPAKASNIYRSVGPGGTVTFSDRAPDSLAQSEPLRMQGGSAPTAALPFALQQARQRFPVQIYTARDCAACQSLRQMLQDRGVPFTEKTIASAEDHAAFQRLSGKDSVPFGTIGRQALHGFSASEWTQYLDAAGYPTHSQLPAHYQAPPASPLVGTPAPAPAPATAPPPTAARIPSLSPLPSLAPGDSGMAQPGNPAGIRF